MSAVDGFDTLEATPSRICINSIRFSTKSGSFRYAIDDSNILVKNLETRTSRTPRLNVHSIIFQGFSRNRADYQSKSWEKAARRIRQDNLSSHLRSFNNKDMRNYLIREQNDDGWVPARQAVSRLSCCRYNGSVFAGQSCGYRTQLLQSPYYNDIFGCHKPQRDQPDSIEKRGLIRFELLGLMDDDAHDIVVSPRRPGKILQVTARDSAFPKFHQPKPRHGFRITIGISYWKCQCARQRLQPQEQSKLLAEPGATTCTLL